MIISEKITQMSENIAINKSINKKERKMFWKTRRWALNQEPSELDPSLIKALGNVDKYLFKKWSTSMILSPRFSWFLLLVGIILEFLYLGMWFTIYPNFNNKIIGYSLLLTIIFLQTYFLHVPAHYIVGNLVKIRSNHIFIAPTSLRKAPLPFRIIGKIAYVPGLKYDLESLLLQNRWKRALMLSSGVLLSYGLFVLNLLVLIIVPVNNQPVWIPSTTLIFLFFFMMFIFISSWFWYGDLYKVRQVYGLYRALT